MGLIEQISSGSPSTFRGLRRRPPPSLLSSLNIAVSRRSHAQCPSRRVGVSRRIVSRRFAFFRVARRPKLDQRMSRDPPIPSKNPPNLPYPGNNKNLHEISTSATSAQSLLVCLVDALTGEAKKPPKASAFRDANGQGAGLRLFARPGDASPDPRHAKLPDLVEVRSPCRFR